jgi:hypothetical protein
VLRNGTSVLVATLNGEAVGQFLKIVAGCGFAIDDPLAADERGQHVGEAGEVGVAAVGADADEG